MECYGESFEGRTDLRHHLRTAAHVEHEAQLAREWVESPSSSPQPNPSLHQQPTPIAPATETDFVDVHAELEAERAKDASQSAVAAESGIPVLNASSKTTTKSMPLNACTMS